MIGSQSATWRYIGKTWTRLFVKAVLDHIGRVLDNLEVARPPSSCRYLLSLPYYFDQHLRVYRVTRSMQQSYSRYPSLCRPEAVADRSVDGLKNYRELSGTLQEIRQDDNSLQSFINRLKKIYHSRADVTIQPCTYCFPLAILDNEDAMCFIMTTIESFGMQFFNPKHAQVR
jgi:hypothetical protein